MEASSNFFITFLAVNQGGGGRGAGGSAKTKTSLWIESILFHPLKIYTWIDFFFSFWTGEKMHFIFHNILFTVILGTIFL